MEIKLFFKGWSWKPMEEPSRCDDDRLTVAASVAALLAGLQSDDLICCYGGRVTQDNVIDLSINVLFNLISASVAEDELNQDEPTLRLGFKLVFGSGAGWCIRSLSVKTRKTSTIPKNSIPLTKHMTMKTVDLLRKVQAEKVNNRKCYSKWEWWRIVRGMIMIISRGLLLV